MATINWQWGLLTTSSGNGSHRVARKGSSAISPPTAIGSSGVDNASMSGTGFSWTPSPSAAAPAVLTDAGGNNYVFAFWSIQGGTTGGAPIGSSVVNANSGFSVPVGSDNNAKAIAYYVWDFGTGGGPNVVLLDAFDQDTGFFPDDFVNVSPEDGRAHTDPASLYWRANDGLLYTDPPGAGVQADITKNERVTAFDVGSRQFKFWLEIKALTFPTNNGPSVNGTDLNIMPSCRLVAFAVYATVPRVPIPIPREYLYNPWWWIETHGGLVPPGPPPPWRQMTNLIMATLVLLLLLATAGVVLLAVRH